MSTAYCGFCGHSQHEVTGMVAGPTVCICRDCVDLCDRVMRESNAPLMLFRTAAEILKKNGATPADAQKFLKPEVYEAVSEIFGPKIMKANPKAVTKLEYAAIKKLLLEDSRIWQLLERGKYSFATILRQPR